MLKQKIATDICRKTEYPFRTRQVFQYAMRPLCVLFAVLLLFSSFSCRQSLPPQDTPRYIITSPEVGEIVYLLQGSANIVGVTEEVDFPQAYRELTKVGNFGAVSIESIIKLNPSLVLTSGLEQQKLASDLEKMGIETLVSYPKSLDEMLQSIVTISEKFDIKERGIAVRDSLLQELNRIREAHAPHRNKPRIYVEIYGNPIMSVSGASFIGELVKLAGGENIFDELPREYSRIKQEDVILADPEIIILTYPFVTAEDILQRKGWQNITACRTGRIYTIQDVNPDLILRAGPRAVQGAKLLRELFYENSIAE